VSLSLRTACLQFSYIVYSIAVRNEIKNLQQACLMRGLPQNFFLCWGLYVIVLVWLFYHASEFDLLTIDFTCQFGPGRQLLRYLRSE